MPLSTLKGPKGHRAPVSVKQKQGHKSPLEFYDLRPDPKGLKHQCQAILSGRNTPSKTVQEKHLVSEIGSTSVEILLSLNSDLSTALNLLNLSLHSSIKIRGFTRSLPLLEDQFKNYQGQLTVPESENLS